MMTKHMLTFWPRSMGIFHSDDRRVGNALCIFDTGHFWLANIATRDQSWPGCDAYWELFGSQCGATRKRAQELEMGLFFSKHQKVCWSQSSLTCCDQNLTYNVLTVATQDVQFSGCPVSQHPFLCFVVFWDHMTSLWFPCSPWGGGDQPARSVKFKGNRQKLAILCI